MSRGARPAGIVIALILMFVTAPRACAQPVIVSADEIETTPGDAVEVVVSSRNSQGLGGLQFHVRYDASVLQWSEARMHAEAGAGLVDAKVVQPGQVRIALVAQEPVMGDSPLVTAVFTAIGEAGARSAVELDSARAWTHEQIVELHVETEAGSVQLAVQASPFPVMWIAIGAGGLLLLVVVVMVFRRRV